MAKEVIMPKFGFTQEVGVIVAWLKNEGDEVEAGDPIMEVETDKITMEVEAPATGILAGVRGQPGDAIPVTEIIAYILAPGEALPADSPSAQPAAPAPTSTAPEASMPPASATPLAERIARVEQIDLAQVPGSGPRGKVTKRDIETYRLQPEVADTPNGHDGRRVRATPAARRIAHEAELSLASVAGSGPRGRIQADDVRTALAVQTSAPASVSLTPVMAQLAQLAQPAPASPAPASGNRRPFSNMRRAIARNLQTSWQQAPHITFQTAVDMSRAQDLVRTAAGLAPEGIKVTLTAVILKATAWTLRRHPLLNSYIGQDEIVVQDEINLGLAVALDEGLIVPVIRNADQRGVIDLATETQRLSQAARQNKLRPDDMTGGTFSVSNLGMFNVTRFTAIINPPQVAILAIGRTQRVFVPDEDDQPVVRPMAELTLSVDHRAVDGADAARFLSTLASGLSNPEQIIL